uniref:SREBP regulating gene protein n=1 Tax=Marmota marmota marmota TaxID=9994 RepID=A0A8C5ZCY0_MARMA
MVNLAARVWRRLLRKRWVLALVSGLSLIYFLSNRNLLQVQDGDQPIPWKVQFNLGNSSRPSHQCRNSIQGKHLITDDLGSVCERKDLLTHGCRNVSVPSTMQYCCDGCLANGCGSAYEHCVSCCLQPNKQLLLERFLNRAAVAFQNLFMAVEDHFELCWAECRTSSQSVQHENTYRTPGPSCCSEGPPHRGPHLCSFLSGHPQADVLDETAPARQGPGLYCVCETPGLKEMLAEPGSHHKPRETQRLQLSPGSGPCAFCCLLGK